MIELRLMPAAVANATRQALRCAGLTPDEIGHVHGHGLATRQCDIDEARGLGQVFGDRAVPVVAAKSSFGNLGAGGGLVETIASVMALRHGHLFPTLNYETPDPDCPLRVVVSADEPAGDSFVNVNLTPQGQTGAVVVRRFTG